MPDITGPFLGSHALSEGWLTAKQLRSPALGRLFRGVYVPAKMPVTHELRCQAAALIAPGPAVLTGCSAVTVRGLPLADARDPVEFLVPDLAKFVAQPGLDIKRTDLAKAEFEDWEPVRLATPLRATLDILTSTRLRKSLMRTVALLDSLLRAEFVERAALRTFLEHRHDHGVVRARRALELADPRAESIPESELRVLLKLNGFDFVPQLDVVVHGQFLARLDLAVEECRLAVEYDGQWHQEAAQTERDIERRRRLAAAGWEVIVVTKEWLYGAPLDLVDTVRLALARRTGK